MMMMRMTWLDLAKLCITSKKCIQEPNSKTFPFILQYFTFIQNRTPRTQHIRYFYHLYPNKPKAVCWQHTRIKAERKLKGFSLFIINVGAIGVSVLYWELKMVEHLKRFFTQALQKNLFSGLCLHIWVINLTLYVGRYLSHCVMHVH